MFEVLWKNSAVRRHIRALLAEFLGQLHAPDDEELSWFAQSLGDEVRRRAALSAMSRNDTWVARLEPALLPMMMEQSYRPETLGLLADLARIAPARAVALLERHWGPDPDNYRMILHVLRFLPAWDEEAMTLLGRIFLSDRLSIMDFRSIIAQAAEAAPLHALRLVGTMLSRAIDTAMSESAVATDADLKQRVEDAFLWCDGMNMLDLGEFVRHDTATYVVQMLPIFVRAAKLLSLTRESDGTSYAADPVFEVGEDSATAFADSIEDAVTALAANAPELFLTLAQETAASEAMAVHRVLVRGYAHLPMTFRLKAGLDYLLADPRRLSISTDGDPFGATIEFLHSIAEAISDDQIAATERAIFASRFYAYNEDAPVEVRRMFLHYERRRRARLLATLPRVRLSASSKQLITDEALPASRIVGGRQGRRRRRDLVAMATIVHSPVSAAQMDRAKDEHLLNLFGQLTDAAHWSQSRRLFAGGSIEVSREFGEFAKQHPNRAVRIIQRLQSGTQENPVAHALAALAEVGWRRDAWEQVVLACDVRGFSKEEFRWHVAHAIGQRAQKERGASDEMCMMLERWLAEFMQSQDPPEQVRRSYSSSSQSDSERQPILFSPVGGGVLPRGNYPALRSLFLGLMLRQPPATDRWLGVLEEHLGRHDSLVVWEALALELRYVARASDRVRAAVFLESLFAHYPSLYCSAAGIVLLGHSQRWVDRKLGRSWIAALRNMGTPFCAQAAGELVVLGAYQGVDLGDPENVASADERVGVAFAAAHLWEQAAFRSQATALLSGALVDCDHEVRAAALRVMSVADAFAIDDNTRRILDVIAADLGLAGQLPERVWGRLGALVPGEAERVMKLMERLLDAFDQGLCGERWVINRAGPQLVELAVTLQRLRSFRERGLSVFERLLVNGVYGVEAVLFDLDGRPRQVSSMPRMPRRFAPKHDN